MGAQLKASQIQLSFLPLSLSPLSFTVFPLPPFFPPFSLCLFLSVSPVSVSLARTHTALKKKKVVVETKGKEKLRQTPASTSPVAW